MTAPMTTTAEQELHEERCCDSIAEDWVRLNQGDLVRFRAEWPEIIRLFDFNYRRGTKRIDLLVIVDQWEETHGLTLADLVRLRGEVEGSIVAHMRAYGRR